MLIFLQLILNWIHLLLVVFLSIMLFILVYALILAYKIISLLRMIVFCTLLPEVMCNKLSILRGQHFLQYFMSLLFCPTRFQYPKVIAEWRNWSFFL